MTKPSTETTVDATRLVAGTGAENVDAMRIMDGADVERVRISVNRMRSTAFMHLRGEDGKLHTFAIETADWDRIVAEQTADKYAHEA